jgi:hypothetical protein
VGPNGTSRELRHLRGAPPRPHSRERSAGPDLIADLLPRIPRFLRWIAGEGAGDGTQKDRIRDGQDCDRPVATRPSTAQGLKSIIAR